MIDISRIMSYNVHMKGKNMSIEQKDTSKKHFYVSLVKSGIRIGAAVSLILGDLVVAGVLLMIAEFFGIAEEL